MSKGSARRPGEIPDDAWEWIFAAPIEPGMPVIVDADEDDNEADIPGAWLEPDMDNEQENEK